jgi:hypothetical protein
MQVRNQKQLDLEILPKEAKKELLDFYEYLLNKYGRAKKEKVTMEKRKLQFFESVKKHSFVLPENYRFNREELHER